MRKENKKRHDYSRGVQRKEERSSEVQTSSARLVSELRVRPSLFRQGA